MTMMDFCAVALVSVALSSCVTPRAGGSDPRVYGDLETIVEDESQDGSSSNLPEALSELQDDPLDISQASVLELQQLPGISPIVARRIYEFSRAHPIQSLDDLTQVEGLDLNQLELIRPLVTVGPVLRRGEPSRTSVTSRSRLIASASTENAGTLAQLQWSDMKVQQKVVARSDREKSEKDARRGRHPAFLVGVVTEKDQGEGDIADFISASLQYTLPSAPIRLIVGDFVVRGAQGIVFSGSQGRSKGSEVIGKVGRKGGGIKVSLASESSSFLRGMAGMYESNSLSCSVVYSRRLLDADVDSNGVIVSFPRSGLHRSEEERSRKNAAAETLIGGRLDAELGHGFDVGLSFHHSLLDHEAHLGGPWGFSAGSNSALGLDMTFVADALSAFGEIGRDDSGALSGNAGFTIDSRRGLLASVIIRSYAPGFFNMHGSGFGEVGEMPANEQGVYSGLKCDLAPWFRLSLFYDQFSFPWRRSTSLLPSGGHECVMTTTLRPLKSIDIDIKYRFKAKSVDENVIRSPGVSGRVQGERNSRSIRVAMVVGRSSPVIWKSRIDIINVQSPLLQVSEHGMMVYQEITATPCAGLRFSARGAAFETDSFESALYVYETELPGTYLTPALFGRASRWYVTGHYDVTPAMRLSAKVARTRLAADRHTTSPLRISLQLDARW